MVYHPHVHYLIPGGGVAFVTAGNAQRWQQTPRYSLIHHRRLSLYDKEMLADELLVHGLNDLASAAAWQKAFVVDIEAVEDGRSVVAYLAPHVHCGAISNHPIK